MSMYQQQLVYATLVNSGDTVSSVSYPGDTGYSINYTSFYTLGNTNDTVTLNINGNPNLTFSMVGKIDMPIDTITLTSVQRVVTGSTAAPTLGVLVVGVKRLNAIFGNTMFS